MILIGFATLAGGVGAGQLAIVAISGSNSAQALSLDRLQKAK
jgi:hypothetical protein